MLKWASEALQNDREIVSLAVRKHTNAIQYASQALQNNEEILLIMAAVICKQ